jgi:hypothetical protein
MSRPQAKRHQLPTFTQSPAKVMPHSVEQIAQRLLSGIHHSPITHSSTLQTQVKSHRQQASAVPGMKAENAINPITTTSFNLLMVPPLRQQLYASCRTLLE